MSYRELQDMCTGIRKHVSECKLSSTREELIEVLQRQQKCKVPSVGQLLRILKEYIKMK